VKPLRWALAVGALAASLASAECTVSLVGDGFDENTARRARAELALELAPEAACQAAESVHVTLTWQKGGSVTVSVNGAHGGTEREFRRFVNPAELPADGLPFTLAAVASELVGELGRAPAAIVERPPPTIDAAARAWSIGARAAGEGWSRGQLQAGGEIALRWSRSRLGLELSAGGRASVARAFDAGVVRSSAAVAGLALVPALVKTERVALCAEVGVHGGGIWFSAAAHDGFTETPRAGWLLDARAGLELALGGPSARFSLRAGADVPLHGVSATVGTQELLAVGGVGGYVTLGGAFAW
jgi:hypothetical protein